MGPRDIDGRCRRGKKKKFLGVLFCLPYTYTNSKLTPTHSSPATIHSMSRSTCSLMALAGWAMSVLDYGTSYSTTVVLHGEGGVVSRRFKGRRAAGVRHSVVMGRVQPG